MKRLLFYLVVVLFAICAVTATPVIASPAALSSQMCLATHGPPAALVNSTPATISPPTSIDNTYTLTTTTSPPSFNDMNIVATMTTPSSLDKDAVMTRITLTQPRAYTVGTMTATTPTANTMALLC